MDIQKTFMLKKTFLPYCEGKHKYCNGITLYAIPMQFTIQPLGLCFEIYGKIGNETKTKNPMDIKATASRNQLAIITKLESWSANSQVYQLAITIHPSISYRIDNIKACDGFDGSKRSTCAAAFFCGHCRGHLQLLFRLYRLGRHTLSTPTCSANYQARNPFANLGWVRVRERREKKPAPSQYKHNKQAFSSESNLCANNFIWHSSVVSTFMHMLFALIAVWFDGFQTKHEASPSLTQTINSMV